MVYPKCIFCLSSNETKFNTKEHIIPESLGGGEWCILPKGLFCDDCQNKFGSTIEQQALATQPLILFRILFGIPTKKKKQPWFSFKQGKLISWLAPGEISYEANNKFKNAYEESRKLHTLVSSEIKRPEMLARTLIKIGLETIAYDDADKVFQRRFDACREFALTGNKNDKWYLFVKEDMESCNYFLQNFNPKEYNDNFYATVIDLTEKEDSPAMLHLKLLYIDLVIPLTEDNFIIDKIERQFGTEKTIIEL
jgi:HNH endonuclease